MQCFRPIKLRGPDDPNPVPCGKCFACQSNRRSDWHMRIKYEMLHSLYSLTVTLTYDDEHIPSLIPHYSPSTNYVPGGCDEINDIYDSPPDYYYYPFDIDHVQRFFKRLRKSYQFRYFGVAEYGGKRGRPHYHIIFFFNQVYDWRKFRLDIYKQWFYGIQITIDETNDDCIGYTLKYCIKPYTSIDPNPKVFMSKKPFIGAGYLTDSTVSYLRYRDEDIVNTVVGEKRLPRIYRDKLYSSPFDEDLRELQKANLQFYIEKKRDEDKLKAFERGMTIKEYDTLRRDAFTARVWRQLKKKSL